jgi:hypothetical protein
VAVLAMHMEAVLAEVDADERNVLHDGLRPKRKHPTRLDFVGWRGTISLTPAGLDTNEGSTIIKNR